MNLFELIQTFYPIDPETFHLLESKFITTSVAKDAYLVKPGQVQNHFYFVTSGIQMVYFETGNKHHIINFTYPPYPSAIPESFMLQKPSVYYLKCLTETEVNSISYDELQQLFDASQKIERLFRKMTENLLAGVLRRYVELHSLSIEERFRIFTQRSPHLLHIIPHKYISSYLGMNHTNFSKLYNSIKI